jgi:hypothetical protein
MVITLSSDDVKKRFGPLFSRKYLGAILSADKGIEAAGLYGERL